MRPVRLAYKPYFFNHDLSAKSTVQLSSSTIYILTSPPTKSAKSYRIIYYFHRLKRKDMTSSSWIDRESSRTRAKKKLIFNLPLYRTISMELAMVLPWGQYRYTSVLWFIDHRWLKKPQHHCHFSELTIKNWKKFKKVHAPATIPVSALYIYSILVFSTWSWFENTIGANHFYSSGCCR